MLDKIKTTRELAFFLGFSLKKLKQLDPEQSFASFYIKKPGTDEMRLIEYPKGDLQRVLDRLCDGLQWLYLDHITPAAYGFIRKIKPCKDPRDIYTNAKRHIGKKYLLNIDLDDFFHQIDTKKVMEIFADYRYFSCNCETEDLLTKLVTYKERLPMGSPTSPPLSNFATIDLDNDLLTWARRHHFVYTRFVDDLSFSSNMKITDTHFNQIAEILQSRHFVYDKKKTKFFGPEDIKEVTGLVVGKTISIPDNFTDEFRNDIYRFKEMYHTVLMFPDGKVFDWLDKFKQVLNGRLAFMKMIYGVNHPTYIQFSNEIKNLYGSDNNHFETSISWRYAGYEFC
jgi:RNA-directed DNA polymerase